MCNEKCVFECIVDRAVCDRRVRKREREKQQPHDASTLHDDAL